MGRNRKINKHSSLPPKPRTVDKLSAVKEAWTYGSKVRMRQKREFCVYGSCAASSARYRQETLEILRLETKGSSEVSCCYFEHCTKWASAASVAEGPASVTIAFWKGVGQVAVLVVVKTPNKPPRAYPLAHTGQ